MCASISYHRWGRWMDGQLFETREDWDANFDSRHSHHFTHSLVSHVSIFHRPPKWLAGDDFDILWSDVWTLLRYKFRQAANTMRFSHWRRQTEVNIVKHLTFFFFFLLCRICVEFYQEVLISLILVKVTSLWTKKIESRVESLAQLTR